MAPRGRPADDRRHGDHRSRDRRRRLPPLDLPARHLARRLHHEPVPPRRRRAAAVPLRPARRSSRSCPRPCPGCCRWSGCAGSPSVTSRPTSAVPMNQWLAAAPSSQVAHGELGCMVSIADMADRPPRPLAEGEVLDIGGHRLRQISTPHVPHAWEAQVLFDESTGTLLCGDLFTQVGSGSALVHDADMVSPALEAEDMFRATCLTPSTAPTMRVAGRPGAPHPGAHARPVVHRRLRRRAARPRRRLRRATRPGRRVDAGCEMTAVIRIAVQDIPPIRRAEASSWPGSSTRGSSRCCRSGRRPGEPPVAVDRDLPRHVEPGSGDGRVGHRDRPACGRRRRLAAPDAEQPGRAGQDDRRQQRHQEPLTSGTPLDRPHVGQRRVTGDRVVAHAAVLPGCGIAHHQPLRPIGVHHFRGAFAALLGYDRPRAIPRGRQAPPRELSVARGRMDRDHPDAFRARPALDRPSPSAPRTTCSPTSTASGCASTRSRPTARRTARSVTCAIAPRTTCARSSRRQRRRPATTRGRSPRSTRRSWTSSASRRSASRRCSRCSTRLPPPPTGPRWPRCSAAANGRAACRCSARTSARTRRTPAATWCT